MYSLPIIYQGYQVITYSKPFVEMFVYLTKREVKKKELEIIMIEEDEDFLVLT